ncbi:hypothetical protein [Sphingomonas sp. CROZ-RG-20F-R02-07]|uniref:hypothetical protein n=1 Tax=Sphingomonas sp. CROZ-RG-20F-R02-07 TaxID=2914832 RepID=UPI001F57A11E|nr:hypothetical protein [Sphingomonas sp. CROZ-RG-20F-R02-07]
MFDWIERCLDAGEPLPTDAAIVDRFVFQSTEQARTLLADLADAGRITIKGYGDTRTISLGRSKPGGTPALRVTPSVKRADRDLDAGVAKIASILGRGKSVQPPREPAPPALAPAKPEVASTPTSTAAPTPPREEPVGTTKSITFVATGPLVDELKRRTADGTPNNRVVLEMLEELMASRQARAAPPAIPAVAEDAPREPTIASVVADLYTVFDGLVAHAGRPDLTAELAAANERAAVAEARAVAAEDKLAQARALFA